MVTDTSRFVEVREPHTDKLLFKFDPHRDIIEVAQRGIKTVVDLSQYRQAGQVEAPSAPNAK
jgi:hypothetical protein